MGNQEKERPLLRDFDIAFMEEATRIKLAADKRIGEEYRHKNYSVKFDGIANIEPMPTDYFLNKTHGILEATLKIKVDCFEGNLWFDYGYVYHRTIITSNSVDQTIANSLMQVKETVASSRVIVGAEM